MRFAVPLLFAWAAAAPAAGPVAAVVEASLPTAAGHARQFALDGDPATAYVSAKNPGPDDYLTVVFDAPVAVKAVTVLTGKADGTDALAGGALEGSADGA